MAPRKPCVAHGLRDQRTGEVMCTTPPLPCNSQMGVQATDGVRQQLQAKVSGSLADRGVSTSDLWNTKPKAKLTEEELRRLDRQRANKRKWARKERERSRKELETLRNKNGNLEYLNEQLKRQVEKLSRKHLHLRSALIDHQCHSEVHNAAMVRIVLIPTSRGRQTWIVGGNDQEVEMDLMEDGTTSTLRRLWPNPPRRRLASDGDEERQRLRTISGWARVSGRSLIIQNGVIKQFIQHNQQPPPQTMLTIPKLATATTAAASFTTRSKASEFQQHDSEAWSSPEATESSYVEAELYRPGPSDGTEGGQSLMSGGFSLKDLAGKSFMEMLQEDADGNVAMLGNDCTMPMLVKPQVKTEPAGALPTDPNITMAPQNTVFPQNTTRQESGFCDAASENSSAPASYAIDTPSTSSEPEAENSLMGCKQVGDKHNKKMSESDHDLFTNLPRASDATVSKTLKKVTKKGVLMDRWLAEKQAGITAKNSTKSSNSVTASEKTSRASFVNPWAVMTSTDAEQIETNQSPLSSSGYSSSSALGDLSNDTTNSGKDRDFCPASNVIATTSATITTHPAVTAMPATVTGRTGMAVSSKCELPTGTAAAVCATAATSVEVTATTTFPAATKTDPAAFFSSGVTHTSRPAPARATSWHGDLAEAPRAANRTRYFSLPTSLSDVVLDEIEGIVEEAEEMAEEAEAEEVVDSDIVTAALGVEKLPQTEVSPDLAVLNHGEDSGSSDVSRRSREAELTPIDTAAPTVSLVASEEVPSTPSTPLSPAPCSPFRARQPFVRNAENDKDGRRVQLETDESGNRAASWEILYEVPAAGESGKEPGQWQASGTS